MLKTFTRIKLLLISFVVIFVLIVMRLFYWQVVSYANLSAQADEQHWKELYVNQPRGEILSSDGFTLVGNEAVFDLILDRSNIASSEDEILDKLIDIAVFKEDEATQTARLEGLVSKKNVSWIKLFSRLPEYIKNEIDRENYAGLVWQLNTKRDYPEASTAAHLLGFVADNSAGEPQGYFGLEGYYDLELMGKKGKSILETDAIGNPIVSGEKIEQQGQPGRTLLTHLDRTVQVIAERELESALDKYEAVSGTVTVLNPKTGAVLAMAALPDYEQENFSEFPKEYYPNPIVNQSFEPGSTFKVLIMAAAINENLVNDETICPCKGPAVIAPYTISTWDGVFHPNSNITEIIKNSDNVGMVFVAKQFEPDILVKYLRDFGFGELTNIDLEDEATSTLRKSWREIDLATSSFGQGIAVTPLQLINSVAALANDGWLMQPQVVDKIVISDQKTDYINFEREVIDIEPVRIRQVVSASTAHNITDIMVEAVKNGEAKWTAAKGYRIAGKTGTAQIPVAGHYDAEKTIASFVGYAPADDPKFIMLVTIREPKTSQWGSETAAPLWFDIAKQLFLHWNIAPSES